MKAIILAGGNGERFWPLSTPKKPKQFLSVFGNDSLIRQSVSRLHGLVDASDTYVITSAALAKTTMKELPELPKTNVIGEPMRRDTGAAVALSVAVASKEDDILAFFPSDQLVVNVKAFQKSLKAAAKLARTKDVIVTLGIQPQYPATGFGYVDPKKGAFVEKPDVKKAKAYIKKGFLWNAGMFIGRASVFRNAFAEHAKELLSVLGNQTIKQSNLQTIYEPLPRISFDFAVMEKLSKAGKVAVVPCDCGWDDVGSYTSFDKHYSHDANGNVVVGPVTLVDAEGNITVNTLTSNLQPSTFNLSILGVSNLVVVVTPDGVLVADKSRIGEMKKLFQ